MPKKLLVLVIDAACPVLLRRWAADGTLPNLARLMATGIVGSTESFEGHYLGSPWWSFCTGVNAGRHGLSWIERLQPGTYRMQPLTAADVAREKALWEVLSEAGRRVLVMDVPLHAESPALNGGQVVEWRVHDSLFGHSATPKRLMQTIRRSAGRHPAPLLCDAPVRSVSQYCALADQLARGAAARARWTRQLLAGEPWDFAIQVFGEAHCAGHQLWHFHDPANPAFDAAVTAEHGDLVRNVYVAIDAAIGDILSDCREDVSIAILTLHGMANFAGKSLLLPEILARLGVATRSAPSHAQLGGPRGNPLVRALGTAYRQLPAGMRETLYDLRTDARRRWIDPGRTIPIDPERTKCFHVPNGPVTGAIRLNLRGREPRGTLSPGTEAEAFCAELSHHLLDLVDPDSARRLVTRVWRATELFHGPRLGELPDLLVEWDLEEPVGNTVTGGGVRAHVQCTSERTGLIDGVNTYGRTGDHRIGGMFIVHSPGIAPGKFEGTVSNLDFAPTFARFLDVDMPSIDGRPVAHLLGS